MSHGTPNATLQDVLVHLRNKNLGVFPERRNTSLRLADRLLRSLDRMRARALAAGGWEVVVSEQIVEVPLVLRALGPVGSAVLDFGGYESTLPLTLAALGYDVTVLDQRVYPFCHPRLTVLSADIFADPLSLTRQFDVVVSISTIEHVGLGHYGDVQRPDGDREAVARLWSLVRPGGRLLATVPAGQPSIQRGYRIYDEARIRAVFPHAVRIEWYRKEGRTGWWAVADAASIASLVYRSPTQTMPAEAVAFVVCDKRAG